MPVTGCGANPRDNFRYRTEAMKDRYKSKGQLISELEGIRRRVGELEVLEKELDNEQRWPEKALHETEKRYQALLETNLYAIMEIDIYGIITFMNSVMYNVLGYRMGELRGAQIWDLLAGDAERDQLTEYLTRVAEGEYAPFPWVGTYLRQKGDTVRLQVDWKQRSDSQGRITGFVSVISALLDRGPLEGLDAGVEDEAESEADEPAEDEAAEGAIEIEPLDDESRAEPDGDGGEDEETEFLPMPEVLEAESDEAPAGVSQKLDEIGRMMQHLYSDFHAKLKDQSHRMDAIDGLRDVLLAGGGGAEGGPAEAIRVPRESDANMERELKGFRKELALIRKEFQGKLKFDTHKNKIIDKLHQDLQAYKGDFVKKSIKTIIMDLIQLIDNIRKLGDHYSARDPSENDPGKLLELLKNIPSDLEDLFYRQGVHPFTCESDDFDPTRQRVLKTLITQDPDKDKTVAESLRPGYEWDGQVIRPEMVAAYIYKESESDAD